ncbi:MAG: hypothetical protein ACFFBE_09630 [Promethearchaeota archaeon]
MEYWNNIKTSMKIAFISIIAMAISFYFMISTFDYFRIIIGVLWIILQLSGIYRDSTNKERFSDKVMEVGVIASLLGGYHINARLAYTVNILVAIGGILVNYIISLIISLVSGLLGGSSYIYYELSSEVPIILLWVLSCILNLFARMYAIPPRKFEDYKKTCKMVVFNYLKQNKGNAFSVSALKNRMGVMGLKYAEKDYFKDHIKEVLSSLAVDGKIESTVQNEEVYYLIP